MPVKVLTYFYSDSVEATINTYASMDTIYSRFPLPAGYWQVGMMWRITGTGKISSPAGTGGGQRYVLGFSPGGYVWDITALQSARTGGSVDDAWYFKAIIICQTIGTLGVFNRYATGFWVSPNSRGAPLPSVGPGPGGEVFPLAAVVNFDTTIPIASVFFQTFLNGVGLKDTMLQYMIEEITP